MDSNASTIGILAIGSFWGAVTLITVVALGSRYYLAKHSKQCGYNLAMKAFERGATTQEVERLLVTWQGNEAQAKDFMQELEVPKKQTSAGKAYASPTDAEYS